MVRSACAAMLAAVAGAVACGGTSAGEPRSTGARLHGLTVAVSGSGTVSSAPQGIDCGAVCAATFDEEVSVVFNAHPAPGWRFSGWSGACSGIGDCAVTLSGDASVSASFDPLPPPPPAQRALTIEIAGQGRITSLAGLDCSATCTTSFADGTRVTLNAAATSGWQFSGWSGACAGAAASCVLTLTADARAAATFTQVPPPPAPVSVRVTPSSASLTAGGTARFTASVDGAADQGVLWSVAEGQAGGSVDATGAYTAPANAGTYHVVATSKAAPGSSAVAVVTVTSPPRPTVTVAITPADIAAPSNAQWRFTAQVTGASDTSVTWSVREGSAGGTIDAKGMYISPMTSGEYHVVATSNADPSASATALVRTDTPLVDQGGPVQPVATVYAIWWGSPSVFADAPTQLATLFSGFDGTPYLRTLDQYMRGSKATVSFAGNLFDSSPPSSALMTNVAMEAEICGLLDAHNIAPRQDGLYFVFVDNIPSGSTSWHNYATCHGMTITIALVVNADAGATQPEPPDVCGRSQMVDGFSLDAAHELFEAMTDPTGKGWKDKLNAYAPEIGDKCASIPTFTCAVTLNNGSTWRLPYMWSNAQNQCVLGTH